MDDDGDPFFFFSFAISARSKRTSSDRDVSGYRDVISPLFLDDPRKCNPTWLTG